MKKNDIIAPSKAPTSLPGNWDKMTGDEKYQYYSDTWANPEEIQFKTTEIAQAYKKRASRVLDVVALKEPDEVPVNFMTIGYILNHDGIQPKNAFYDVDSLISNAFEMHKKFDLDYSLLADTSSGQMLDTLGMRLIRWPGSSVPGSALPDDMSYQYVEDEYMREDEYDELINNPEGYILRKFLPRICSGLTGLGALPNLFNMVEAPGFSTTLSALGTGTPARQALDTLLKAADQAMVHKMKMEAAGMEITAGYGAPSLAGGITFAPCDMIGDTMRCTMGIVKDIYRQPEKVLAAVETLVPMAVQIGIQAAEASRNPFILIPLHKGSDNFMSPEQFKTFYWPSLKATLLGLIDGGCIPMPFLEGAYNQRLDIIGEDPLPSGRSLWIFDRTDMKAAKAKIGSWGCIGGNVPASLFKQGTPAMLENYCKDLIETCAPGGGFFLFPGTIIDQANSENIARYTNCGRKFGKYELNGHDPSFK